MSISQSDLDKIQSVSDDLIRSAKFVFPSAELHEIGAIFLSIGCFLTASAIPDLWRDLKSTAIISQSLLDQETMLKKYEHLNPKPT